MEATIDQFGAIIAALVMYLAPALVAIVRRHHQAAAITTLNLLLGWTVLGWIFALIWAVSARRPSFG